VVYPHKILITIKNYYFAKNYYDAYVEEGLSDDIILERVMRDYINLLESLPVATK